MFHFRKIKVILLINVASKLIGFIREAYVSYLYGISQITDTFFAVQQIPVIISNYMFGAFNLAFVPQYTKLHYSDDPRNFLSRIIKWALVVGTLVILLMLDGRIAIIPKMLGVKPEALPLAIYFTRILSLTIIPIMITGISYGILHSKQEHVRGMLLPALSPCIMVASMVMLSQLSNMGKLGVLPWSFVIGSFVSFIWGLAILRKILVEKKSLIPSGNNDFSIFGFVRQLFASSIENIGFNVNQVLTIYFAGTIGAGAVAINAYALRIAMLPLSGIVSPANQMIQASLSKARANDEKMSFVPLMAKLTMVWVVVAFVIILLREHLVMFVYQRGAFTHNDTLKVAQALIPYSFYFIVMATNQVFARYFFAVSRGGEYSKALIIGYIIGNCLKPFLKIESGLSGIIWACVIGEGLATIYFAYKLVYKEYLQYE